MFGIRKKLIPEPRSWYKLISWIRIRIFLQLTSKNQNPDPQHDENSAPDPHQLICLLPNPLPLHNCLIVIILFLVPAGSPVARRGSGKSPSILSRLELVWNCMLNAQLDTVPASVRASFITTAAPAPSMSRSLSCSWSLASASLRDAIILFKHHQYFSNLERLSGFLPLVLPSTKCYSFR